ncbi:GNAT family N-acetyltransferase [Nocardioides sp. GCM10028917]|uniref:GNAT family N-acetyltransferase n=1 Tax=Nocardioides sp. GCM10028917 TaxID=3273408 RepID=UPI00360E3858
MPPVPAHEPSATCRDGALQHLIERGTTSDADAIATALADAFLNYPFTDWMVPADNRVGRLRGLFSLTVGRVGIPYGDTFVARCAAQGRGREIVGAVVGIPASGVPDEVWASMAPAEEALLAHRAEASAQADQATRRLRPTEPHYTIATMGVAGHHRRRGLAEALLEPVLAAADDQTLLCYLETSSASNVRLYRRAGFTVRGSAALPHRGPTVWGMSRLPTL